MGERGAAQREALAQRSGRQMDAAQQFAGLQDVAMVAGDEIDRRQRCAARRRAATA